MAIIALLKRKGGSGSSTLAANIAAEWTLRGFPTALLDCDPQKTLVEWANLGSGVLSRIVEAPEVQQGQAFRELVKHRAGAYSRVVLDCAPGFDPMALQAAVIANVIVIPVRPSPLDTAAALDALEVAVVGARGRDDCTICFAPSANLPRTRLGKMLPEALKEAGEPAGALVLPSVNARIVAAEAVLAGMACCEFDPTGDTTKEFRAVVDAIDAIIAEQEAD